MEATKERRLVAWWQESLANIRKGKWWLVIVPVGLWLVSGLAEDRFFHSINHFLDEHAPDLLARVRPILTFKGPLGLAIIGFTAVLLILIVHAYFETRTGKHGIVQGAVENAPRLFLEYSNTIAAQYGMTNSGLSLKNDGGRAFNVDFEPEVRASYTLLLENPTRSIDRGDEYAVHVRLCEQIKGALHPVGGMLSGQIQTLFDRLSGEGEADNGFTVTIKCVDYEQRPFVARTILKWDRWTKQIRCERV